jgi:hypothetical protein
MTAIPKEPERLMIRKIEIERFSLSSSKPFDEVLATSSDRCLLVRISSTFCGANCE